MGKTKTMSIKKQSPTATLYLSLFDNVPPKAIQAAQGWQFAPSIHRPLNTLLGHLIPDTTSSKLASVARRQFFIAGKTRGSASADNPRDFTFRYEMGAAPSLTTRDIGTTLLQRSFLSGNTYDNIGNTTADPSTLMIVIHAYNANIVQVNNEAIIPSNHTAIAACTFHLFPKESPSVCFVSYLAVTDKQFNSKTVTGLLDSGGRDDPIREPPFRSSGYGFARLLLRMASLIAGSRYDPAVPDSGCQFRPIILQTQMDSHSRSCFLRLGCVPINPRQDPDLSRMNDLDEDHQKVLNYQPTTTEGIVTLGIFGKPGFCLLRMIIP
jgi:hypothetical protein